MEVVTSSEAVTNANDIISCDLVIDEPSEDRGTSVHSSPLCYILDPRLTVPKQSVL